MFIFFFVKAVLTILVVPTILNKEQKITVAAKGADIPEVINPKN